jgi:putative hydrolase of the HAD superfamily
MIGDNAINDIRGARENINAVTLQKIHSGVELGTGANTPDASFDDFATVRQLLSQLAFAR